MTRAIINRAIGAAIFAAILVVVVPRLFDGSGDVRQDALQKDTPSIVEMYDTRLEQLPEVTRRATEQLKQLEQQQQNAIARDGQGRSVSEQSIQMQLVPETDNTSQPASTVPSKPANPLPTVSTPARPAEPKSAGQVEPAKPAKPAEQTGSTSSSGITDELGSFISAQQSDWVVQMGLFAQRDNATKLHQQLSNLAGLNKSFIKDMRVGKRNLIGVFSGPYVSHSQAEQARKQLFLDVGLEGYVRSYAELEQ